MAGTEVAIAALSEGNALYSSIQGNSFEDRKALLNAVTSSEALADHIGKTINLAHVVVQSVDMVDTTTGQTEAMPRTILIDDKGKAFHAISKGTFLAIKNVLGILGEPSSWPGPVPIQVVQEGQGTRKYFTIKLV